MISSSKRVPGVGDVLGGRYVLGDRLGEGGMGVVFRADEPALARAVAIKILHPHLAAHETFLRRFRDEAIATSRMSPRGGPQVIELAVADDGTPYIAMELVEGRPLGRVIAERELPLPRALAIFRLVLEALGAAHARGIVHADVKSDNFMLAERDGVDVVTMIDFGLAQLDGANIEAGFLSGTPEYMAPEQVRGECATRVSDLYGAGVILYELLTGTTPFAGRTTNEVLDRQLRDMVVPPSLRRPERGIPPALDRVVLRALDKDPAARFASTEELAAALDAIELKPACEVGEPCGGEVGLEARAPGAMSDQERRTCQTVNRHLGDAVVGAVPLGRGSERRAFVEAGPLADALARGDCAAVAASYLESAAALAREHRLGAAICELEEGVALVNESCGARPGAAGTPDAMSRLVAALSALYELAGDPDRARQVLAIADARSTLVADA